MDRSIKAVLLEDQQLFRETLAIAVAQIASIQIIGTFASAAELLAQRDHYAPDVIIADLLLPGLRGAELVRQLKAAFTGTRILVVSGCTEAGLVQETVRGGADGYVMKDSGLTDLQIAVEAVAGGGVHFCPRVTTILRQAISESEADPLTARERRIVEFVAEGQSSRHIAHLLNISVKTVENQRSLIMRKLGITTVAALTRYAVARGLVPAAPFFHTPDDGGSDPNPGATPAADLPQPQPEAEEGLQEK